MGSTEMQAVLKFDLPDDQYDFDAAINAVQIKLSIQDLDNFLRHKLKYEEISDDKFMAFTEAREKLWEIIREREINIFD